MRDSKDKLNYPPADFLVKKRRRELTAVFALFFPYISTKFTHSEDSVIYFFGCLLFVFGIVLILYVFISSFLIFFYDCPFCDEKIFIKKKNNGKWLGNYGFSTCNNCGKSCREIVVFLKKIDGK